MYKPPENSNRVKNIKSKFENGSAITASKPPLLRKCKTSLDLKISIQKTPLVPNSKLTHPSLSKQLSDSVKCNIKRTPAFRVDRNILNDKPSYQKTVLLNKTRADTQTNVRSLNNNSLKGDKISQNNIYNSVENAKYNFSYIRNKFDEEKALSNKCNSNSEDRSKTDSRIRNENLKFLYAEPLPKSQRLKCTKNLYANVVEDSLENLHNSSTLKISDNKVEHKSDDESKSKTSTNFERQNIAYGSLRNKKSLEDLTVNEKLDCLTDSLKHALKKPLPQGPAPKKPPRTFLHNKQIPAISNPSKISPSSLERNLTNKLSDEIKRNRSNDKAIRNDPKLMLEKLESVIKSKGRLLRKSAKANSVSEEDSDIETSKNSDIILSSPISSTALSNSVYYSTPPTPTSGKFNFSCLPSLGCVTSSYERIKESNSSFFVPYTSNKEPVYAEPFQYQANLEDSKNFVREKLPLNDDDGANKSAIRRSVHYASSLVPDISSEVKNHMTDTKNPHQAFDSTSPCSTSTNSMASTPSNESAPFLPVKKVKDLIKAIENINTGTESRRRNSEGSFDSPTNNNRLIKLENELKNTLDNSFLSISTIEDKSEENNSESESNEPAQVKEGTKRFETYVKRIRSQLYFKPQKKKDNLFHCCLLVALNRNVPYIKSKYPEYVQEPYRIADLCFPEVENGCMDSSVEAQCYSLIITNENGERTFGYCRRVLPEASNACLPLAYCILSKHRAPGFYQRILKELELRHGYPDKVRYAFLKELCNCKFPLPGETVVINCCGKTEINGDSSGAIKSNINSGASKIDVPGNEEDDKEVDLNSFVVVCNNGEYGTLIKNDKEDSLNGTRGASAIINGSVDVPQSNIKRSNSYPCLVGDFDSLPSKLIFNRPHDARHEESDLKSLIENVKRPILQKIFSSLLLERKVIFVSGVLSKLSSCIEALQIILYPFSWQHTIIPVLPRSLWEIVDTPTPLVCGVLSAEVVDDYDIENGIVVDLDAGEVLLQVGDEDTILPACLIQILKDGLNLANTMTTTNSGTHNVFLSDAFLRVFIQCCSHYKDHIKQGKFEKSEFLQVSKYKGKHVRQFLKWFTETSMFYNFLEAALSNSTSLDLFEQRIKIYCSESATVILNKMKGWSNYKHLVNSNLSRFY